MAGPAQPFSKGRLVLVFVGLAILIVGAWLVLRQPSAENPVETAEPLPAEQPIAVYLARGDAARGEVWFARCAACHTIDRGGRHGVGPNLWGVAGAPLGTRAGYSRLGGDAHARRQLGLGDAERLPPLPAHLPAA